MTAKLTQLSVRLEELNRLLSSETVTANLDKYRKLTRERAEIAPVVELYDAYLQSERDIHTAQEMSAEITADAEVQVDGVRRLQVVVERGSDGEGVGVCHRERRRGRALEEQRRTRRRRNLGEAHEPRKLCRSVDVRRGRERCRETISVRTDEVCQRLSDQIVVHAGAGANRALARAEEESGNSAFALG